MKRKLHVVFALFVGALLFARPAAAQFTVGYTDIGPIIGVGNIGSASIAFGGRFEHAIKTLPEFNNGILSVEASVNYYSWSWSGLGYSASVKYIPFGVTANYHFPVKSNPKLDPFLGVGLGYQAVTCNVSGIPCGYSSSVYFIGRAGGRYFFSPKMALYADLGAGAAVVNVGVMFKLH